MEFEDYIASEYSWRRKELTNLSNVARSGRKGMRETLFRSAIPIIYAHWEGFVKQSSIAKMNYLISQGLKYRDLQPCFHVYAILEAYGGQIPAKQFEAWVDITTGKVDYSKSINTSSLNLIDTKSNLKYEVLREVAVKVGVDYKKFELKENWINETLVGLRNKICHGERAPIAEDEFEDIYTETAALIDIYKDEILYSVQSKTYLKTPV
ncbi:MAE_28990/MAE_18760 family HEPN-like nuclease [Pseudomonas sp. TWRC1-2]|uniref:MAE_28990/MAE_18760 family HEPN-like nuclease n=1 Tax=Pseudomonas sp. TWRC1-2 TaxID=2804628 RepID=UPI003CF9EA76